MATFTFSCDEELHSRYMKQCHERGTNKSKEFRLFMENELSGVDNSIQSLQRSIEALSERVKVLEPETHIQPELNTEEGQGYFNE